MQAVAWAATLLGWTSAWIIGNGRRSGWIIALLAAVAWLAVDASFGIWAGITSAAVSVAIAARNLARTDGMASTLTEAHATATGLEATTTASQDQSARQVRVDQT